MRRLSLGRILAAFVPLALALSVGAADVPRDKTAIIQKGMTQEQLNALAEFIRANRYRCDSISAASRKLFSPGIEVTCNNWRYSYEVVDRGGRWTVCYDEC